MKYEKKLIGNTSIYYLQAKSILKDTSSLFLKEILNNEYNIYNYEIIKNKNGKPYLKNSNLFFNISHKKDIIVIAVSDNEVGIDIEYIDKDKEIKKALLNSFFSKNEINYIDNNIENFFEVFTKKESYIKMLGKRVAEIKYVDIFNLNCNFNTFRYKDFVVTVCSVK